jgi:hypothetical protein
MVDQTGEADELACRPGSVPARLATPRSATIHLGLPLPTTSCGLPADSGGPPSIVRAGGPSLTSHPLDLAPSGVYLAAPVTRNAGGLLHHRFTLTDPLPGRRFAFCGTVPRVTPGGRYPPPCPSEPGPSSGGFPHAVARPAHPGISVGPSGRCADSAGLRAPDGPTRRVCGRPTRRLAGVHAARQADSPGQGRVRISAPAAVTSSVCSNCALRRLSLVTTVQPSGHMSQSALPRHSIGSMVNVMPASITVS